MRSFLTLSQRFEVITRMSVIYGFMAFLLMLNLIAAPYPLSYVFSAPFVFMAVYYWSINRPAIVPMWLVFLAGLSIDLLGGLPLGLNALSLIAARQVTMMQGRLLAGQGFIAVWLGFLVICAGLQILQWAAASLLTLHLLPMQEIWISIVFGTMLFPLIFIFCI